MYIHIYIYIYHSARLGDLGHQLEELLQLLASSHAPWRVRPISRISLSLLRFVDSIRWLELPGNSLWTWEFHPLHFNILLESNPLKSRILVRRLAVRIIVSRRRTVDASVRTCAHGCGSRPRLCAHVSARPWRCVGCKHDIVKRQHAIALMLTIGSNVMHACARMHPCRHAGTHSSTHPHLYTSTHLHIHTCTGAYHVVSVTPYTRHAHLFAMTVLSHDHCYQHDVSEVHK